MCSDLFGAHARTNVLIAIIGAMIATLVLTNASAQETAPATQSTLAETHVGQGYEALKQENYDAAVSEFRAALSLDPTLGSRARMPLAIALFESHHPTEAKQELETVRQQSGPNPSVSYYLGRLDLEENKFGSAIQNLTKAMSKPPFPDTAYYLGFAYFKNGNLPAGEKWLTEAAKATPTDSRVQYQLGVIYRKQGRPEEARKALVRSKELRDSEDSRSKLSTECAQRLEQAPLEAAHSVCDQLYDPNDSKKLTVLGTIYGQHGHLKEALKPLRRAAELEPQSPQMQYNLAYTYFQMKRFADARAPLETAVQRWPDLFPLNALYGAVLWNLGDVRPAYEALHRAHQLNAQDAQTNALLEQALLELAKHADDSQALQYLAESATVAPADPEPHRRMAEFYRKLGKTEQAHEEEEKAENLAKTSRN